ncbi:MAG TPA: isoprenyl transferase [Thermoguttaceae bacterium]|nr:isoprenyl transferase [Thermoguttaceae bacterium]
MKNTTDSPAAFFDVPPEKRPRHIAIIMDGNGRWARRQGLPRVEGHRRGVSSVRRVVEECGRLGIEQLTLYCLSSENWKRPEPEIDSLMHLLEQCMVEERTGILEQNIGIRLIGRREGIPEHVLRQVDKTVELTGKSTGPTLCLAINYGARAEVVDAVRAIAEEVRAGRLEPSAITEQTVDDHLYTAGMPEPDLLIRTAGEMRLSNFLLWQLSYAEIWVTEKTWPEFDEELLRQAIRDYAARTRRFGGLDE